MAENNQDYHIKLRADVDIRDIETKFKKLFTDVLKKQSKELNIDVNEGYIQKIDKGLSKVFHSAISVFEGEVEGATKRLVHFAPSKAARHATNLLPDVLGSNFGGAKGVQGIEFSKELEKGTRELLSLSTDIGKSVDAIVKDGAALANSLRDISNSVRESSRQIAQDILKGRDLRPRPSTADGPTLKSPAFPSTPPTAPPRRPPGGGPSGPSGPGGGGPPTPPLRRGRPPRTYSIPSYFVPFDAFGPSNVPPSGGGPSGPSGPGGGGPPPPNDDDKKRAAYSAWLASQIARGKERQKRIDAFLGRQQLTDADKENIIAGGATESARVSSAGKNQARRATEAVQGETGSGVVVGTKDLLKNIYDLLRGNLEQTGSAIRQTSAESSSGMKANVATGMKTVAQAVETSFDDIVGFMIGNLKLPKPTIQALGQRSNLKLLAERHQEELRKQNIPTYTEGSARARLSSFPHSKEEDFEGLIQAAQQVGRKGNALGQNVAGASIKDIEEPLKRVKNLISGVNKVSVGEQDAERLKKTTSELIKSYLAQTVSGLYNQVNQLEEQLRGVAKTGTADEVESVAKKYAAVLRNLHSFYRMIERSGDALNINLVDLIATGGPGGTGGPTGTGGAGGRGGRKQRLPEAEFLDDAGYTDIKKKLSAYPKASAAFEVATDFERMPDIAERTRAVFKVLFTDMESSSGTFRNNIAALTKALGLIGDKDLVNQQSLQDMRAAVESYYETIKAAQSVGLPGRAGKAVKIPYLDSIIGEGETDKAAYAAIDRMRSQMATSKGIPKGMIQSQKIEVEDAAGAVQKLNVEFRKFGDTMDAVKTRISQTGVMKTFSQEVETAIRRVSIWGTASGIMYGAVDAFRNALKTIVDTEVGLVNLSKVMVEADIDIVKFGADVQKFATDQAQKFGLSIKSIYEGMAIFAQQGMSLTDTMKLTEATAVAANVAQLTQTEAAESLTAATRQFNIEASNSIKIVDAWNEISNRNAISVRALADATKKAGSAAATVGIEYEQFLGLVTAVGTATRQPGKEIGTSLKFIFQRTLRPETQQKLERYGVTTKDTEGNFRGFIPVLSDLASKWDDLSDSHKLAIAQAMGGALQYNIFLSLMKNFDVAVKATSDAINSQGSAMTENQKMMGTLSKKYEQAKASLDSFYISLGTSFLPVLKGATDGLNSVLQLINKIPDGVKAAGVAFVGMATLATLAASKLDYLYAGTATMGAGAVPLGAERGGTGLISAAASYLGGRGRTQEEIGAMPSVMSLTPASRAGLGVSDMGAASRAEATKALAGVSGKFIDINRNVVTGTENMSKLSMAVKNYSVIAYEGAAASAIGFSALNSPISKAIYLMSQLGKAAPLALLGVAESAAISYNAMGGLSGASLVATTSFLKLKLASVGIATSLGLFAVVAYTAAKAIGWVWDSLKGAPDINFGEEAQKKYGEQIAKKEDLLKKLKQELALTVQVDKLNERGVKADKAATGKRGKPDISAVLERNETRDRIASFAVKIDPTTIESIDDYGRATLKTTESVKEYVRVSAEAKAAEIVGLRKNEIEGFAKDSLLAIANLGNAVAELKKEFPLFKAQADMIGVGIDSSEFYSASAEDMLSAQQKYEEVRKKVLFGFQQLPSESPLESYAKLYSSEPIKMFLDTEASKINGALKDYGVKLITGADVINQLFMKKKLGSAGRYVKESAAGTESALLKANVAKRTISDIEEETKKGREGFRGNEIVIFDPKNDFGLTQATVTVDSEGKKFLEGITSFGASYKDEIENMKGLLSGAEIFDTTKIEKEFSTSVYRLKKQFSGAGAGLVSFPTKIDLGMKFGFELSGLDRVQTYGKAAIKSIEEVSRAQQTYTTQVDEHSKKTNTAAEVLTKFIDNFNQMARSLSLQTFTLRLMTEVDAVSKSFEKASYDIKKARLADVIETKFATTFGSAGGFTKAITPELTKIGSDLSGVEKVAQYNPEVALASRDINRMVDSMKKTLVQADTTYGLDIPLMAKKMPAKDELRFMEREKEAKDITQKLGGDIKFTEMVMATKDVQKSVEQIGKAIVEAVNETRPGYAEEKARRDAIERGRGGGFSELPIKLVLASRGEETGVGGGVGTFLSRSRTSGSPLRSSQIQSFVGKGEEGEVAFKQAYDKTYAEFIKEKVVELRKAGKDPGNLGAGERKKLDEELRNELIERLTKYRDAIFSPRFGATEKPLGYSWGKDVDKEGRVGKDSSGFMGSAGRFGKGLLDYTLGNKYVTWARKQTLDRIDTEFTNDVGGYVGEQSEMSPQTKTQLRMGAEAKIQLEEVKANKGKGTYVGALEAASKAGVPYSREELSIKKDRTNSIVGFLESSTVAFASAMRKATEEAVMPFAKKLMEMQEMVDAVVLVQSKTEEFANALTKGVRGIENFYRETVDLAQLRAPITGAAAGLPQVKADLGKFETELSPEEGVLKRYPATGDIMAQEMSRVKAVDMAGSLYQQLLQSADMAKEKVAAGIGGKELPNKEAILALAEGPRQLFGVLQNALSGVNKQMAPFIEALRELTALEKVKQSLRDIMAELRKAEELRFDTTSIDMALGRHPLSPTGGVFGQPANLNKFQRQEFELDQKRKLGGISGTDFKYQKDKLDFDKEEANIAYKQAKENEKLSSEVTQARKAMDLLWDAQYKGDRRT
jgi:TP901 family phage tail tape measure protein